MSVPAYYGNVYWDVIQSFSQQSGIPMIPLSELPRTISELSDEAPGFPSPTSAVWYVAERRWFMKKEAEEKAAVQKIVDQHKATEDKYTKLLEKYQELLAAYIAEKKAHDEENEVSKGLKQQLNSLMRVLQEVGLM